MPMGSLELGILALVMITWMTGLVAKYLLYIYGLLT